MARTDGAGGRFRAPALLVCGRADPRASARLAARGFPTRCLCHTDFQTRRAVKRSVLVAWSRGASPNFSSYKLANSPFISES